MAIFSLEMTKDQLVNRVLSSEAAIDSQAFRTGQLSSENWQDLARVAEVLAHTNMFLDDTSNITIPEMKAKIRRINQDPAREDIGLVIIDYLQLMSTGKRTENRVQEISEITRNLKIMAKELNVPIIALSQLSRSAEKNRTDHRPVLSDLRDSGSIEQDADVVLFLYREAYYDNGEEAGHQHCRVHCGKKPPWRSGQGRPRLGRRAHPFYKCGLFPYALKGRAAFALFSCAGAFPAERARRFLFCLKGAMA